MYHALPLRRTNVSEVLVMLCESCMYIADIFSSLNKIILMEMVCIACHGDTNEMQCEEVHMV